MKFRCNSDTDKNKYCPTVKHKAFGLDLKSSLGGLIIIIIIIRSMLL